MGFMSPSLGFASTMGAFIGGAAGKESQILDEQRAQQRDDDLIWGAKFQRGLSDYQKESQKRDTEAQMMNSLIEAAKGDQRKAQTGMLAIRNGSKFADVYNSLVNDTTAPDTAYKSDFIQRNNQSVMEKYNNLDQMYGQLSPRARQFSQMPERPQYPNSCYQPPVQQTIGQPTQFTPPQPSKQNPMPGGTIPGAGCGPAMPPNDQSNTTSQGSSQPGGVIPHPAPVGVGGVGGQPTSFNLPSSHPAHQGTGPNISLDPSHYSNRQAVYDALIATGKYTPAQAQAIANGMQTQEQIQKDKLDQWNKEHPNAGRTLLQDKFVTSLQKRIDAQDNYSELATDATNGIQALQEGKYKSNAAQPLFDIFNKVLSSMGNNTLEQMGLANRVSDYNMMQKIITRMQFGQIPNYHLGRWTEREVGMLNNMINSGRTDENTNMKILLLIKNNAERTARNTADLAEVAGTGSPAEVSRGLALQAQQLKQLQTQNQRLPWTDVDPANNPDAFKKMWNEAPPGTWFNDTATGRLAQKPYPH